MSKQSIKNTTDAQAKSTENMDEAVNSAEKLKKEAGSSSKEKKDKLQDSVQNETVKKAVKKSDSGPSLFSRFKGYILWLILFAGVAIAVVLTRDDLDWQVQHINDLQFKVAQLQQANLALESRLDSQIKEMDSRIQESVSGAMTQPENQAIVTQADLEAIQKTTEQQLALVQEKLMALSGTVSDQASSQVDKVISSVSEVAETAFQPTEQQREALTQLEEKLQMQLSDMGGKLAELFDFKSAQQALPTEESSLPAADKLSATQLQQWIVEINTQWLLQGREAETRQQLLALEQAISLSDDVSDVTRLASLIGQDLAYLEQSALSSREKSGLDTGALKQAINALKDPSMAEANRLANVEESRESESQVASTEGLSLDSAIEQLKSGLSSMISVKKREDALEQTKVESLILQDVLIQRALLLVDRIDWAIVSQSNKLLARSIQDLQNYIDGTFASESAQFKALLKPISEHGFSKREPLMVMKFRTAD